MSRLVVMTRGLAALVSRDKSLPAEWVNDPASRVWRLDTHLLGGGDPRTPPADWRPTYPLDDQRNEPDLWISDQSEPTIWCKLDRHRPYHAPFSPEGSTFCDWCKRDHEDVMDVYTFMLPEEW